MKGREGVEERLQKLLSAGGVCSRRRAEEYLKAGRVAVNGRTAALGDKADAARDEITVDGAPVLLPAGHTYVMLNKPRGYVTTLSDERGRRTVTELTADCGARVWPVGRLDLDSEGLLLLTDDGALTNRLLHPAKGVEKEYLVWTQGDIAQALEHLRRPMVLDGERLEADRVTRKGEKLLSVVLHQGKNRQVRRMCAAAGLTVTRLKRIRVGPLRLGELPVGRWRSLTQEELRALGVDGSRRD